MKNAGRYQMQYRCFIAYPYCMPGIIASVKPGNNICFFSKKIYYFAFAFIAKLRTYYCYVFCHEKGKRKSVFKGFAHHNQRHTEIPKVIRMDIIKSIIR